jgi:hypothetical protein
LTTFYIYTCLWNIDTKIDRNGRDTNELRGLDTDGRYRLLDSVVNRAWLKMMTVRGLHTDHILATGADWLYVFVAPEYYFAASDRAHAIPQDDKERLVGRLSALSATLPTMVFCPGTIAWKKPMIRSGAQRFHRGTTTPKTSRRITKFTQRTRAAVRDQEALVPHHVAQDIAQNVARYPTIRDQFENERAREQTRQFFLDRARGRAALEQRMYANLMNDQDRCYIARNTAYGFYNGREVARYHKRSEYAEVFDSESDGGYVIYEPGGGPEGAGDRFDVEGVKFGVEVCLDHQLGYLSQGGGWYPDVQIIMSADVQYVEAHSFVKEGGFVVHASSNRDCTKIYQNVGGVSTEIPAGYENVQAGRLYYARLTLERTEIIEDYF